jgi:hypothetical protein
LLPVRVTISPGLALKGLKKEILGWARTKEGNHTTIIKIKAPMEKYLTLRNLDFKKTANIK